MTVVFQVDNTDKGRMSPVQRGLIVLARCVFAVSASRMISCPFVHSELWSKNQEVLAESVNKILKKGDSVIVINYPLIYVLCDFYSPIHDYGFNPYEKIFGENPTVDLCKINNFIVFNKQRFSPVPDDDKLEQLSFRKTDTVTIPGRLKIDFFIYKRALPCI